MRSLGRVAFSSLAASLGLALACSGGEDKSGSEIGDSPGSGGRVSTSGGATSTTGGSGTMGGTGSGLGGTGGTSTGVGGEAPGLFDCQNAYTNLESCGTSANQGRQIPVDILLVVDKSGSMNLQPQGYADRKWPSMRAALGAALTRLADFASFGLELFPRRDVTIDCQSVSQEHCCEMGTQVDVPIGPGSQTVPQILTALDPPTGPGGRTPTAAALSLARQYFAGRPTGIEGSAAQAFVILATDGGPNCGSATSCTYDQCTVNLDGDKVDFPYYCGVIAPNTSNCCGEIANSSPLDCLDVQATLNEVDALLAMGIQTVVVGIPGSEPYADALNQFAIHGGHPQVGAATSYYQVEANNPDDLTAVFVDIASDLIQTCDIYLEEPPTSLTEVNVAVDCEAQPQTVNGEVQWVLDASQDPAVLRLQGALCQRALNEGIGSVEIVFGCQTIY